MTDAISLKRSAPHDVKRCARCGKDHTKLVFVEFSGEPIFIAEQPYNWFATCPETGDPILLALVVAETKKQRRRREKR